MKALFILMTLLSSKNIFFYKYAELSLELYSVKQHDFTYNWYRYLKIYCN